MTITLTNTKKENLKLFCTNILNSRTPKIRTVASLLGKITSTFPAAKFGKCIIEAQKSAKQWHYVKAMATLMPDHTSLKQPNLTLDDGGKM